MREWCHGRLQSARRADIQAFVEAFNDRLGDECLNIHWFLSLAEAQAKIKAWRPDYNESRPRRLLGWLPQIEYAAATAKIAAKRMPEIRIRAG